MATVLNDMGGSSKLIEDCKWNYEEGIVKQDVPNINNIERVGKVFYTCSYLCPKCRNFMLKANAGEYVKVQTTHGIHKLKSVFACNKCQMLYSAVSGQSLSWGNYYVMKDKNKFKKVMDIIDIYGISLEQLQKMGV